MNTASIHASEPVGDVLLTMASYGGTLAAARSFGRLGLRVTVADPRPLAAACLSRHVSRRVPCPDAEAEPDRFIEWLLALGDREPGQILYPTSDDVAWMLAKHRDALERRFRMYLPPLDVVYALLNKWRLYEACLAVGVDVPATRLLRTPEDVARARAELRFPAIVKPQTQALFSPHQKGRLAREPDQLEGLARELRAATTFSPVILAHDPDVAAPMVQAFAEGAADGIYGLSGFVDETGELFVVEASRKVLQWPRRMGVGLCFEEAEVRPELADGLARLCRRVGYYGAFEVEYVESGGRHLLIDFNPRFYGQMAFDISRGLDLPLLVHLATTGDRRRLRAEVEAARRRTRARRGRTYCHRIDLELSLGLHRVAGRMGREDGRRWHRWLARHRGAVTDAVLDRRDWLPGLAVATSAVLHLVAHPRSAWRAAREG